MYTYHYRSWLWVLLKLSAAGFFTLVTGAAISTSSPGLAFISSVLTFLFLVLTVAEIVGFSATIIPGEGVLFRSWIVRTRLIPFPTIDRIATEIKEKVIDSKPNSHRRPKIKEIYYLYLYHGQDTLLTLNDQDMPKEMLQELGNHIIQQIDKAGHQIQIEGSDLRLPWKMGRSQRT